MTKIESRVKGVRIGPRKLARVLDIVRGQLALDAMQLLRFMPQKGARILEKAIKSAVANAKNNYKLNDLNLVISEAYVNKGMTMKRMRPRARGRGFPIFKRTAHLTVCLTEKDDKTIKQPNNRWEPKEAA
ncbi:50S ribosomal protein L22 [Candidatus Saganbacteria bacterium]|nr:50S ribosomal protein L22 [Candidatus Saganbacteria bacterium]